MPERMTDKRLAEIVAYFHDGNLEAQYEIEPREWKSALLAERAAVTERDERIARLEEARAVAEFDGWVGASILYPWRHSIAGLDRMDLGEAVPAIVAYYRAALLPEQASERVPEVPERGSEHRA